MSNRSHVTFPLITPARPMEQCCCCGLVLFSEPLGVSLAKPHYHWRSARLTATLRATWKETICAEHWPTDTWTTFLDARHETEARYRTYFGNATLPKALLPWADDMLMRNIAMSQALLLIATDCDRGRDGEDR